MKITLDLTRAEAHELNLLIQVGKINSKPRRTTFRAVTAWTEAFLAGAQADD